MTFLAFLLFICAIVLFVFPLPTAFQALKKAATGILFLFSGLIFATTAVGYNDAGYCSHIRTIFGSETSKCDLGWYFSGWGQTTTYPHFITIAHTSDKDAGGSAVSGPYTVRLADNWAGEVTQTTRFGIPTDEEQFLKMANDFRSPERLITSTLRPAVTASVDSVANLFTMEEYYAGGRRDDFKTEFRDALIKGRAVIERKERVQQGPNIDRSTAPSTSNLAGDTAQTGGADRLRVITSKKLDSSGNEIRIKHGFNRYGITVSTAILQNLDPDDAFEEQIKERKDAAARRSVARERRLEQEEQRLLALANSERAIAERQGEAREEQIKRTTDAETERRLALIAADKAREEAKIAKETAQLALEKAEIDAQALKVQADAEAYQKREVLEADGALAQKLDAWIASQRAWANAFSNRKVPSTVFATGSNNGNVGTDNDVKAFMDILTLQAAKQLQLDLAIQDGQKNQQN